MRRFVLALFAVLILVPGLIGAALAQTTPTLGEKQIGTSPCTNSNASADFDTLAQCSSTGSTTGTFQKAPLFVGAVTSPPYPSTACSSSLAGMIQYTASGGFQGCNGTSWGSLSSGSGSCSVSPLHGSQLFTSSGTFTPPTCLSTSNYMYFRVLAVGGGASGNANNSGSGGNSDGGYGSGYVSVSQIILTSSTPISVCGYPLNSA
jgi:hypothetical protein